MPSKTEAIPEIEERLRSMQDNQVELVLSFVRFLTGEEQASESYLTMLATEDVLRRDWDRPEEDAAWADL